VSVCVSVIFVWLCECDLSFCVCASVIQVSSVCECDLFIPGRYCVESSDKSDMSGTLQLSRSAVERGGYADGWGGTLSCSASLLCCEMVRVWKPGAFVLSGQASPSVSPSCQEVGKDA